MNSFHKLLQSHAAAALDKQRDLADLVGSSPARLDLNNGRIRFGEHMFEVQVLGVESPRSGTWRWAWSDAAGTLPDEVLHQAHRLRNTGEQHEIEEFRQPTLSLDRTTGEQIAMVAVGLTRLDSFCKIEHAGRMLYLLLSGPALRQVNDRSPQRVRSVFLGLLKSQQVDAGRALRAYFKYKDYTCRGDGDALVGVGPDGRSLRATFDQQGKLESLRIADAAREESGAGEYELADACDQPAERQRTAFATAMTGASRRRTEQEPREALRTGTRPSKGQVLLMVVIVLLGTYTAVGPTPGGTSPAKADALEQSGEASTGSTQATAPNEEANRLADHASAPAAQQVKVQEASAPPSAGDTAAPPLTPDVHQPRAAPQWEHIKFDKADLTVQIPGTLRSRSNSSTGAATRIYQAGDSGYEVLVSPIERGKFGNDERMTGIWARRAAAEHQVADGESHAVTHEVLHGRELRYREGGQSIVHRMLFAGDFMIELIARQSPDADPATEEKFLGSLRPGPDAIKIERERRAAHAAVER
jgi:hypothetical protein